MIHNYECKYQGKWSFQLPNKKIVEFIGGEFCTDNDELAKGLEETPQFGTEFWSITEELLKQKTRKGRTDIKRGGRGTD